MTGACSGGRPRPCWHWLRCPRPGGRLRCTMTVRGRGGGERPGGNYLWSRAAFLVRAALAAMRPLLSAGCDAGRCRGQKTPPTEPRLWLRRRSRRTPLWERPWPRHGLCCPPASMQVAVGVRRPLPQDPGSGSDGGAGEHPCGSGLLTATRRLRSAGFDSGCYREQARYHRLSVSRAARAGCAGRNRTTRCPAWRRDWGRR